MKTTIALALLLTSVLLASCDNGKKAETPEPAPQADEAPPGPTPESSASTADYAPVDDPTWGRAIVTGAKPHRDLFESKFREVSGLNDADAMAAMQIGCTRGCQGLPPETQPLLEYIFPREYPNILSIFGQAWDATQLVVGDADFSLSFDAAIPAKDCGPPEPQPCQSMPYCPGDRCGFPPAFGACNRC
jgi:hypothetical protein